MRKFKELTVLAAMVLALSNQKRTEAWKPPQSLDKGADEAFSAQSMVETKWGTPYTYVTGFQVPNNSLVYLFETASGTAKGYDVEVEFRNECAGMGTLVDSERSEVSERFSNISSADDCQELCGQTRNCVGAAYDESASTCSLMKSLRGLTQGLSTVVVPSCDSECFQEGKKISESGTSLGFAPNPNICQAMCEGEPTCRAFTWTWTDKQCFSYANGTVMVAADDAVSGRRASCSLSRKEDTYAESCMVSELSSNFYSHEILGGMGNVNFCKIACLSRSDCNYITYNSSTRKCYIKRGRGSLVFSKRADSTGPKYCDTSCFLKDIEYEGERVATTKADKASHCHYECFINSKCIRWTYEESTQGCYFFGETNTAVGARSKGFWSGPKGGCGIEPLYALAAPDCALKGIKYSLVPLQAVSTSTATECQQRCQADSNCKTFAFNTTVNACELHGATTNYHRRDNHYFISGPKNC
ncbi:micronemal protein 4 [Cyclospora cayetanensis]|uniref:Micronemal protein 4 n=1 Tax=Cyclospora cayetanensis TaxID=88456 RepID=A0A6P6RVD2_9EIME|nr:micronemal protein 4 [Cyclospora cayetanensis]